MNVRARAVDRQTVSLPLGDHEFRFRLDRKSVDLAGVEIDQWWMPLPSVYPTNGRPGGNFGAILAYYWAVCRALRADGEPAYQDVYLLANLLPHTRGRGAGRVVADGVLSRGGPTEVDLEALLRETRGAEVGEVAFRDSVADAFGPKIGSYSDGDRAAYLDAARELLGAGRYELRRGAADEASAAVRGRWEDWRSRTRSRHADKAALLDVFSYECRAALHKCYSAVWNSLIGLLAAEHGLSDEGVRFHQLWHVGRQCRSRESVEDDFHLFCGHVFALHPAGAAFVRAEAGRALLGDYLRRPDDAGSWRRLLAGLRTAAWAYSSRRDLIAEVRRHRRETERDVLRAEEEREERRRGRHRPR